MAFQFYVDPFYILFKMSYYSKWKRFGQKKLQEIYVLNIFQSEKDKYSWYMITFISEKENNRWWDPILWWEDFTDGS